MINNLTPHKIAKYHNTSGKIHNKNKYKTKKFVHNLLQYYMHL